MPETHTMTGDIAVDLTTEQQRQAFAEIMAYRTPPLLALTTNSPGEYLRAKHDHETQWWQSRSWIQPVMLERLQRFQRAEAEVFCYLELEALQRCKTCGGEGWLAMPQLGSDEPIQMQCEACEGSGREHG